MAKPRNKKLIFGVVSAIVAVVVIMSVVFIYYSPEYSWSSSIRDHDGDGVPDKSDLEPFDADIWASCKGFINLTIHNNISNAPELDLYIKLTELDSEYGGPIGNPLVPWVEYELWDLHSYVDGNLTRVLINKSWWNGPESINWSVRIYGAPSPYPQLFPSEYAYWEESVVVSDAQTTTLYLEFPDDFVIVYIH